MSSNIRIKRVCQHCEKEFTAKTTVTKYCGDTCAKRAYKARKRNEKIEAANGTLKRSSKPKASLHDKRILTVNEASEFLGCSTKTIYRLIKLNKVQAINLGERMTRIDKVSLEELFAEPSSSSSTKSAYRTPNLKDCYSLKEISDLYGISQSALYTILKKYDIAKFRQGKFSYVLKNEIDRIFDGSEN
ncbi:hypothetical protein AAU57_08725 [Nonlabens sp. YIK11]|uniref:helix-turn-helix transcriptional regulator n=1 Tax=Nonlabens sp. YIK11 TaxID=1453349 RepID=UPI0007081C8B|nr:helix-turn-helix domain-containing protein [Nonlabens sp. YIK11]KQC33387.1 hypothetical protein AAU57_08725 [Nonlabens sp. YIK11]